MFEIHNFDFLVGEWTVVNRRLEERLSNCDDWIEFPAHMETKEILNGLGTMDEMKSSYFGDEFIGVSIRMFDPTAGEWTIYWADTASPERKLTEQVVGTFKDGVGEFFGTEIFDGRKVRLRFIWKKESVDTAHWEQAYYDEAAGEWETNWTMLFTREK